MRFFSRLLHLDPDSREGIIAGTSALGIAVNVLIAAVKVIVGAMASSIAIISEGINNASDALTAVLTLVGSRLASRHPDEKHPFGYGRIEYLTGLVVGILIIITGVETLKTSIETIFEPAELSVSYLSLAVVAFSAVIKYLLGSFTLRMGKKADSSALVGVGADSKNDSFMSIVTIVSALLFIIFGLSVDAYAGIFMSLLILKAGWEILRDTISELIGRPGDEELAAELYKEIRATDGVINAVDMMLHNYGPDRYSGSVNVELDHAMTVGEVYEFIHALQLRIMHEHNVVMVFGIYAVDNDTENIREIREAVSEFVRVREHVRSFHAVYLEPGTGRLYCDLIVDYALKDWDALETEFKAFMNGRFAFSDIVLTIENEFV